MPSTFHKPPGIPVFPLTSGIPQDSAWARVIAGDPWRGEISWPKGFEAGILHRLDTSTSGALWLADSLEELTELRALFSEKRLVKRYVARVRRVPRWERHQTSLEIGHDRRHKRRMVVKRGEETPHRGHWLPAHTAFERLHGDLVAATISTGVMHQIRVHAAFLGIPLLGDRLYGGGPTPEGAPEGIVFFLHHLGLEGPWGLSTDPVPLPEWARVP